MVDTARRSLLRLFGQGSVFFAFLTQIGGALRAFIPNVLYEPPKKVKIGRPEDYPQGYSFIPDSRFFIIRQEKDFHAISAVCTHLGCTVQWKENRQEFDCPCHGSSFRKDGTVVGGPAPRPLLWHPLTLSPDGYLEVDTGTEVARDYRFTPPLKA